MEWQSFAIDQKRSICLARGIMKISSHEVKYSVPLRPIYEEEEKFQLIPSFQLFRALLMIAVAWLASSTWYLLLISHRIPT